MSNTLSVFTVEQLRAFEEKIANIYREGGKIGGPVHLSYGNEDQLIEIFKDVQPQDWVFSTHRSHYHALLKGIPEDWLMTEILAGNSICINNPDYRFYSSGIMGDIAAIATGTALAVKRRGSGEQVWCFVGDMCAEMGVFHESVKYAERNALPIMFVVEDNGLSVATPTQEAWGSLSVTNKVIRYEYKNTRYPHAGVRKEYSGF